MAEADYDLWMKLYLAHPISGLSAKEVFGYYDSMVAELEKFHPIMHPMIGKDYLRGEDKFQPTGYAQAISGDHAIVERDYWSVAWSDVVLLDLSGSERVSIGCVMELAWAYQLRKQVVAVLPEKNIHRHAFVLECSDIVFDDLAKAISYIKLLP